MICHCMVTIFISLRAIKNTLNTCNCLFRVMFKYHGILKLTDMFYLGILKCYHKFKNNQLPAYFDNEFINLNRTHGYKTRHKHRIPSNLTRTQTAQIILRNRIPSVINSTDSLIKDKATTHSYHGFSNYIKFTLLKSYEVQCAISGCYICNNNS